MPRPPKQGLDYAGWSVDIFDGDTKIDKLLDAQGLTGFGIYFYLCQMAYKHDGYFYRWRYDDSATTARRLGCGVGSKTVENTVGLCLQIGLFDKPLFDRHGILTSRGIQKRFLVAIQGRRVKTVISEYWLLKNDESKGLDKCAKNDGLQPTNPCLQPTNPGLQAANSPIKESKVNTPHTPQGDAAVSVPEYRPEWFERFYKLYPRKTARKAAAKAWDKLKPDRNLCDVMAAAIRAQMKTEQWKDPQHIPHPSTWLNGARWLDEVKEETDEDDWYR